MLGWSSPLRTSISPQTLASLPLTFFFGITLSATSRFRGGSFACAPNVPPDIDRATRMGLGKESECEELEAEDGLRGGRVDAVVVEDVREGEEGRRVAAAPRKATLICSGWTCHVAR